jgi:hypothetical protein
VYKGKSFWLELKSDYVSYPRLSKWQLAWINQHVHDGVTVMICISALSQRELKLYRIQSWVESPQSLVADAVFPIHGAWPDITKTFYQLVSDN